jgi:serine/threonine protein kinase
MKHLIRRTFFDTWKSMLDVDIEKQFNVLTQKELEPHSFTFYTSVSVMSSSRIEGEQMEVDSYVKHKMLNIEYLPELTEKPNDLYNAYLFAKDHPLTKENFTHAHELISAHLLPDNQRGKLRTTEMLVMERILPLDFRAYEVEVRQLWLDIFEDELKQLHRAGFVHRDLKRPSNIGGLAFDNILLTKQGLRLIDVGISALRKQVGDKIFEKYVEIETKEMEEFKEYFLNR